MQKLRVRPPFSSLHAHEVFAVEHDRVQLCVRPGIGRAVVRLAGQVIEAETVAGVAVFWVDGLFPNTTYIAQIDTPAGASLGSLTFRTKSPLAGRTTKFATISDVHLGLHDFTSISSISEPKNTESPFALRCATAAIREAIDWGAELLLIKGDLTDGGKADEWDLAHSLLDDLPIPVMVTWGNHDVWKDRDVEPQDIAASFGLDPGPIVTTDLDNIRIILADTSIPDRGRGDLDQHREELFELMATDRPVFLGIHHNIMRTPKPWFLPYGVPSNNAATFLDALPAVNRNVFISSGHTHRNRRHFLGNRGEITFTEVSATSDYPGVWAGYEVSDQVVRQTVRRTAVPNALEWSEYARGALLGVWPRWAQGLLDDRSVDMAIR